MADMIVPFLWYSEHAEEAANFYCGLIPDSKIQRIARLAADSPSGPPGSVVVVEFTLAGRDFCAMTAGPLDPFNHAVSFVINCDTQAEIDKYWDGLLEGGGKPEQCGWLRDRYGLCWQIVPRVLNEMNASPDRAAARRAAEAMMKMVKLDIAKLEAAFRGQ
jgi:predicted 3-demethylubiquinone-9 3-methyltransferase (glyoxalase superfamily)